MCAAVAAREKKEVFLKTNELWKLNLTFLQTQYKVPYDIRR